MVAQVVYEYRRLFDKFLFYDPLNSDRNSRFIFGGPSTHISANSFKESDEYRGMSDFKVANVFV
ncbi:MAG: hypothetical protein D6735_03350 [Acidobacteria bacterium]|nr:MAG: hypothetical protein D6735_03350 [Acidobacteriota bacterium]